MADRVQSAYAGGRACPSQVWMVLRGALPKFENLILGDRILHVLVILPSDIDAHRLQAFKAHRLRDGLNMPTGLNGNPIFACPGPAITHYEKGARRRPQHPLNLLKGSAHIDKVPPQKGGHVRAT